MSEPTKTCPKCGEDIRASVTFCTQCGAPLGEDEAGATPSEGIRRPAPPAAEQPRQARPTSAGGFAFEVVEGPEAGRTLPVNGPVQLGRDPGCQLLLAKDDLVSRRHVKVQPAADHVLVEDLGSRNGTFVNGSQVTGPTAVRDGDRIVVGNSTLVVRRS